MNGARKGRNAASGTKEMVDRALSEEIIREVILARHEFEIFRGSEREKMPALCADGAIASEELIDCEIHFVTNFSAVAAAFVFHAEVLPFHHHRRLSGASVNVLPPTALSAKRCVIL